jgi:dTDP-4-amino-4,6-dideoxygalactose transaminase
MVAHFYGQAAEMEPLLKIAEKHKLKVIEDCAHSCGGEYRGKKVGSLGDIGVFSFALAKNMPCFGGGMITTNNDVLSGKIRKLMDALPADAPSPQALLWGNIIKTSFNYFCTRPLAFSFLIYPVMRLLASRSPSAMDTEPGTESVSEQDKTINFLYRLTNLQSAVGLHQLSRLDALNEKARTNALTYNRELQGLAWAQLPLTLSESKHCYLYYRLQVNKREDFRRAMLRQGIDTASDDMSDCSQLKPFIDQAGCCPVAAKLPERIVEIPNNQDLTEKDLLRICHHIRQWRP